jgi:hypothetical protein
MFEALDVLQAIGGDPDAAGSALARAAAAEALQDAREEVEAEARRARLAENAEIAAIQNRSMGDPAGQLRAAQMEGEGLADAVADLESRLAKAKGRLEANRDRQRFYAERAMLAEEGSRRSAAPDPLEAAAVRAADALRETHEGRMVVERARRRLRHRPSAEPVLRSQPTSVLTADDSHVSFR